MSNETIQITNAIGQDIKPVGLHSLEIQFMETFGLTFVTINLIDNFWWMNAEQTSEPHLLREIKGNLSVSLLAIDWMETES